MPSTIDLYINTSAGARRSLVQGYDVLSTPSNPEFVVRDDVRIRIHLMTVASGSRTGTTFDPGVGSTIRFGAKLLSNFVTSTSFLFYSEAFTRDATNEDDVFFYADIDLNTSEFIAAFASNAPIANLRIECEVVTGDLTQTVMQNDAVGLFDVIRGDEPAPTPAGGAAGARFIPVSSNQTAVTGARYLNLANATYTDPTPASGANYEVFVRNGTATIGGTAYTTGAYLRVYHSGAWTTRRYGFSSVASSLENARTEIGASAIADFPIYLGQDLLDNKTYVLNPDFGGSWAGGNPTIPSAVTNVTFYNLSQSAIDVSGFGSPIDTFTASPFEWVNFNLADDGSGNGVFTVLDRGPFSSDGFSSSTATSGTLTATTTSGNSSVAHLAASLSATLTWSVTAWATRAALGSRTRFFTRSGVTALTFTASGFTVYGAALTTLAALSSVEYEKVGTTTLVRLR
jgi:hypothetical protein